MHFYNDNFDQINTNIKESHYDFSAKNHFDFSACNKLKLAFKVTFQLAQAASLMPC